MQLDTLVLEWRGGRALLLSREGSSPDVQIRRLARYPNRPLFARVVENPVLHPLAEVEGAVGE
jgi:hypothetical protein